MKFALTTEPETNSTTIIVSIADGQEQHPRQIAKIELATSDILLLPAVVGTVRAVVEGQIIIESAKHQEEKTRIDAIVRRLEDNGAGGA